jgi:hypothetical protein
MKQSLVTLAIIWSFSSMAWAVDDSLTITYFVQNNTNDATTTTLNLEVQLTNNGVETLNKASLRLLSPAGADDAIQGEVLFLDPIAVGQANIGTGIYSAPKELFNGTTRNSLAWKITYTDGQGQTQVKILLGSRR